MDKYISKVKVLAKLIEGTCGALGDKSFTEGYNFAVNEYRETIKAIKPADVQPVNQWISIKERLPEREKSVLIYYPRWEDDEIQIAKLDDDEITFDICGEFNIGVGAVTHWMPLPEPPKDGETNDSNDK